MLNISGGGRRNDEGLPEGGLAKGRFLPTGWGLAASQEPKSRQLPGLYGKKVVVLLFITCNRSIG